jgi:hypothetical protein
VLLSRALDPGLLYRGIGLTTSHRASAQQSNVEDVPLVIGPTSTSHTMAVQYKNELVESIDNPLSISNRLLSQFEGADIDFYTINFMRMAMEKIRIGAQGQRLFNHSLTNLPLQRSSDVRLQFGWGEQHTMRNLGVQLYEYEHLLLAAALGEYLSEPYAAAVLSMLAERYEDDERPKPRLASFHQFVRALNGVLATSEFPIVVDDRIRLNPYRDASDGMPFAKQPQETLSVNAIVEALCSMNGPASDGSGRLVIAGGDVIGWFSAYADLCLGLDVTLVDEVGTELHRSNSGQNGDWRLILKFCRLATTSESSKANIWLRCPDSPGASSGQLGTVIHSGRVRPSAVFNQVFGSAFHTLAHAESKVFANALGGLARTWEFTVNQDDLSDEVISADNKKNPASWGIGLIQTWTAWFPELRHLQGRMERALKLDHDGAAQQCEDSIRRLEPLCGCYICSTTAGSDEAPSNLPKDGFCLPTLMETIVMLGLALSRVVVTPNLFMSRAGVLAMYRSQIRKRLDLKKVHDDPTSWKRHIILFGEDWNAGFPKRILNALAMFSGSWPHQHDQPESLVGLRHEGIVAYSLLLERGSKRGRSSDDQVIRVVTGSVNWRTRTLNRVCLGSPPGSEIFCFWDRLKSSHLDTDLYVD